MPAYDYRCHTCSSEFEVQMSIAAKETSQDVTCPECEGIDTKHLYRPVGFVSSGRAAEPTCSHAISGNCCGGGPACGCH